MYLLITDEKDLGGVIFISMQLLRQILNSQLS
jgi:hypothetical protein